MWEDPLNRAGGKWIVRLRKGVADRVWEDLVMSVVGDMFDECGPQEDGEEGGCPEICGCTISVRQSEDIVSLWNRVDGDVKVREKIRCVLRIFHNFDDLIACDRDTLRAVLNLPPSTIMEYKSNNGALPPTFHETHLIDPTTDSMQDKSSFRNSAIDRIPIVAAAS